MKLDSLAMLSASPGTIDGPAQGSQHWARSLLICLLAVFIGLLSTDTYSNCMSVRVIGDPQRVMVRTSEYHKVEANG